MLSDINKHLFGCCGARKRAATHDVAVPATAPVATQATLAPRAPRRGPRTEHKGPEVNLVGLLDASALLRQQTGAFEANATKVHHKVQAKQGVDLRIAGSLEIQRNTKKPI